MRKVQRPTPPNEWLHDGAPDYTRVFSDYILIDDSQKPWSECTNEEKEQWEEEHKPETEPEPQENAE